MTVENKAIDVGVLAGKILVEAGSEMWRVEDTTKRIVDHASNNKTEAFTSLTGLLVNLKDTPYTRFMQVEKRGINMNNINSVNHLSRQYTQDKLTLDELEEKLLHLQHKKPQYPLWLQTIGAGFEGAFFMFTFTQTYNWEDFPLAFSPEPWVVGDLLCWFTCQDPLYERIFRCINSRFYVVIGVRSSGINAKYHHWCHHATITRHPIINSMRIFEGNLLSNRTTNGIIDLLSTRLGRVIPLYMS